MYLILSVSVSICPDQILRLETLLVEQSLVGCLLLPLLVLAGVFVDLVPAVATNAQTRVASLVHIGSKRIVHVAAAGVLDGSVVLQQLVQVLLLHGLFLVLGSFHRTADEPVRRFLELHHFIDTAVRQSLAVLFVLRRVGFVQAVQHIVPVGRQQALCVSAPCFGRFQFGTLVARAVPDTRHKASLGRLGRYCAAVHCLAVEIDGLGA
mmetsp:Transcript_1907/g.3122  ORF Transcript_1907/g.3122 Transcript_1907/m.3122 type:complete len:208 (-) Transcript_1907:685-1308(-)